MSQLRGIHNELSLRICGLEGLAASMCSESGDKELTSLFKIGVLLESQLGKVRTLVDCLELVANERGEK